MTRFIVGIDLGTTNTAVAYVDLAEATPRVRALDVPQLVAEGEIAPRPTLPSFVYLAGEHDLPPAATRLPWDPADGSTRTAASPPAKPPLLPADTRIVIGELARTQGARVPGRMIASAKSWLCHAGVDRLAAILPWGTGEGAKLSPVDASSQVLAHVARAWAHVMGVPLAACEIVVTVPASFDEVARELTVAAAAKAGLEHITLVEEPQAVFYAWIDANSSARRRQALSPGERVLVCDVGGGTTDFTLIEVAADDFERRAVGDHLLLGGDNIDIALARRLEARIAKKMDAVQWHGLVHACRLAKETLLSERPPASVPITVAARGTKLIGGVLRGDLGREELEEVVVEGFFPRVAAVDRPAKARAGLHEFGLPYVADAAITRHLAGFLGRHPGRVDAILYNGGAMKPALLRARILEQIGAWQGDPPRQLANAAPDLAVAHGAAYYGLVRRGLGSRIRGGAARAYYVSAGAGSVVCVLPRGAEEGTENELARDFVAVMNRPASFRLYSSSARGDRVGDVVPADDPEILELPPLVTVLRAPGQREARVRIRARLTEIGTLELWCVGEGEGARWRLTFDLRAGAAPAAGDELPRETEALKELVVGSFRGSFWLRSAAPPVEQSPTGPPDVPDPANLVKELERRLASRRDEWSTALSRALWDATNDCEPARARTADVEARWINLAGFLLRPGAGATLDDWRIKEMWKVFNAGLRHEKDEACRLAWWIAWRRIAAGLKRTQQEQFYDRMAGQLVPALAKKGRPAPRIKPSPQEIAEMWRTLASMERLAPSLKARLGDALVERIEKEKRKDVEVALWALGRLGGRAPLYGPADTVVAPDVARSWIERMLVLDWQPAERFAFPMAQIGRRTGDRARDLDDAVRTRLAERLRTLPGGERSALLVEEVVSLEAREEKVAFGDSLPSGLRLVVGED